MVTEHIGVVRRVAPHLVNKTRIAALAICIVSIAVALIALDSDEAYASGSGRYGTHHVHVAYCNNYGSPNNWIEAQPPTMYSSGYYSQYVRYRADLMIYNYSAQRWEVGAWALSPYKLAFSNSPATFKSAFFNNLPARTYYVRISMYWYNPSTGALEGSAVNHHVPGYWKNAGSVIYDRCLIR